MEDERSTASERRRTPVLLVDPDPAALDFMRRTLLQADCEPHDYIDLEEASGAAARLSADPPIEIALFDARALDPLSGAPDLAELRRRTPRRAALQFLLVGGGPDLERVLPRQAAEVTDILTKPLERHTLLYALQEARRRHAAALSRGMTGVADARRRMTVTRREPSAELQVLQWLREVDEQRLRGLERVLEPDANWNMLAELLRARITKRRISVTSLCLASRAPVTTALRRVERLLGEGLITYALDPKDRRRKYVELTAEGANRVQAAVRSLAQRFPGDPSQTPS